MKVIHGIQEMREWREFEKRQVGFVPTMGYLHEGHMSLIYRARSENEVTVVWIFLNPKQFAPGEDLDTYPKDEASDQKKCEEAGVDVVFMPKRDDLYPPGFGTIVETEAGLPTQNEFSEGASRPTFFRGVATVLVKAFNIVQPRNAYFGEKDAQQCLVVKAIVRDLNIPLTIVTVPTFREPDGLAMSSRNAYLSQEERSKANLIFRALKAAEETLTAQECDADLLRNTVSDLISTDSAFRLIYVSVADPNNMRELSGPVQSCIISVAAYLGTTRLIDNKTISRP